MQFKNDERVVLTLDAGGTKFSFSAMAGGEEVVQPAEYPSHADNLDLCLKTIADGFSEVAARVKKKPAAISFAFPGPSYYPEGIIGDLGNLPAFRGGVPLGPLLAHKFGVPVFINNDGDLFALGEALGGFLPHINQKLEAAGSTKRYKNLIGFTIGTGLGGGIVHNGRLFLGDNSAAGEVWLLRNAVHPHTFMEESVCIRALQRSYGEKLTAKEICQVALGEREGNRAAAEKAFSDLGMALGECIANAVTLLDGLVVIGSGVSNAYALFAPAMMQALRQGMENFERSRKIHRLELDCFDLESAGQLSEFCAGKMQRLSVPGHAEIVYDAMKRCGIGRSRLGTSRAVSLGAYVFALARLDGAH